MEDKLERLTEIINDIRNLDVVKNTNLTTEALLIIDDIAESIL